MFLLKSLIHRTFDWQCALSLALASDLAYQPARAVTALATRKWGFDACVFESRKDTQAFIAHNGEIALVAFRGTESRGDWLADLDVRRTKRPYGWVHRGFYNAYEAVEAVLREALDAETGDRRIWLTGHSLGGALATLAAAELEADYPIWGCYTFGQPRVGDEGLRELVAEQYPDRFFRFVNDDDLVPRVPPRFRHAGSLLHFDSGGRLIDEAEAEAVEAESPEPPALSEEEFERLKAEIRAVREAAAAAELAPGVERAELVDRSVEGVIPALRDHRLNRYIAAIRRYVPQPAPEDEELEIVVDLEVSAAAPERPARMAEGGMTSVEDDATAREEMARETVPILFRVRDANWQAPENLAIQASVGPIRSMRATPDQIRQLRKDPGVGSIQTSRDAMLPECTVSVPFVGATQVHDPPLSERGDAALIGVIDTGIDIRHEAFLDETGEPRVLVVWDQTDPTGPSPAAVDPDRFPFDYGTLYDDDRIRRLVQGDASVVPRALRDPRRHGTHVSSIAAGRAIGTFGGGMAPEARLAVVIPDMHTEPGDPPSLGYSTSHVEALLFLRSFADERPMAVNVSLGMNAGAHDGLSNLEAAFDGTTNNGRDPGFVIVKSAGNERGHGGHAQVQSFEGRTKIRWTSAAADRPQDYIEVWYDSLDELEFRLVDPQGDKSDPVSLAQPRVSAKVGGNLCRMELVQYHPDNGASRLVLQILPRTAAIQEGEWTLEILGRTVRSADGRVDAWVERDGQRAVRFTDGDNDSVILSIPGTADSVISVAACLAEDPLQLVPSSSFGPTRTGDPKPELSAPGHEIIAAAANTPNPQAVTPMTGTSMAAPHVTGALALALSRREKKADAPALNARQLRQALIKSARGQSRIHHPGFGFGALDVRRFLDVLP